MATFTLTTGTDHFTGTAGQDNTFDFTPSTLSAADTITGVAGGSFIDIMQLTAGGTVSAAQFTGVANMQMEELLLSNAGNSVTLANNLVAGTSRADGTFLVMGGTSGDTIDGSGITNGIGLTIDGGAGADHMTGGNGNDVYYVDNLGDVVTESSAHGNDIVHTLVDFTLPANVESLVLDGTGNINAVGNSADNALIGNSGNNTLDGKGGNDTMIGHGGDDIYFVDSTSDVVIENAGEGNDIVYASVDYTIGANIESVVLVDGTGNVNAVGSSADNALVGNSGNNTLDGGAGDDTMIGGDGNDIYFIDSTSDLAMENANQGNDIVYASIDYTIGANIESVVLQGSNNLNAVGNDTANALVGNSGNNTLDGKGGDDTMIGGAGNDTYFVDTTGDLVVEALNEGNDIVHATVSHTLEANVESLILDEVQLPGNNNINATGNSEDNALVGNSGNNTLDGEGGSDLMIGHDGNDVYVVDNVGDQVVESLNEGTDTVQASISYALSANVENLTLLETGGAINGTGNSAVNTIIGNSFDNVIDGMGGADVLNGGGGNDTIRILDSAFASIDGGPGLDRITLSGPTDQTFDLTANAAKITNVEIISLTAVSHGQLSLTATDIPQINASGNYLYVVGGSDDEITVNEAFAGDSWTLVSTTHTNSAVAPGATFFQYHNDTTGSDLYIQDSIQAGIPITPNNPPQIFLDGAPDGLVLPDGIDHAASYTTGNAAGVAISDTDATVDDPDTTDSVTISSHIANLTATLTDAHSGTLEYLTLTAAGQTIAANNGITVSGLNTATLTLSNSATDTVYQSLLREIRYVNTDESGSLDTSDRHITVTASDVLGATSNLATATISISNVEHAPTANDFSIDAQEDVNVGSFGNVLTQSGASDVDPGDTLHISQINGSAANVGVTQTTTHGSFLVGADGSAGFILNNGSLAVQQLAAGQTVQDSFTFTVADNHGQEVTRTVTVDIAGNNDAPVAVLDGFSVNEDAALTGANVLSNDTDVDTTDTHSVLTFTVGATTHTAGDAITLANGALLNVSSAGAVTLTQNGKYEALRDGESANVVFSYTMEDSAHAQSSAGAQITINGINDAPTLDLDSATAGNDFSTVETSGGVAAIANNPAVTDGVANAEGQISSITLHLTAASGATDTGEGLLLPPGLESTLETLGIANITGAGTDTLTITATSFFTPATAQSLISQITHSDPDTTFAFNPEDRSITVTVTDVNAGANPGASVTHTTTIDMAANVIDADGPGQRDHFVGANLADTIQGNTGDDTMEGRGGNDQIYGGTVAGDSGHDTAVFTGSQAEYVVTRTGPGVYTVADQVGGRDGTDTVHGVETLHFTTGNTDLLLDAPVQVFDATGTHLLASFAANQLDQAVNYANTHAGANIIELSSAAGPFTAGTWPVDITEAVTIKAVGGTATVNAGSHTGFQIEPSAVLGSGDVVRLEGLNITGDGTTPDTVGVLFNGVYEGPSDGAIQLVGTSASGFGSDGVAIIGGGSGLSVTIDGDNPAVSGTQTATFTGSGHHSSSGGSGDILFFAYTGAAALSNLVVTGTTGTSASSADNGIQIAGFDGSDHSVDHPIGTVSFTNVTVDGLYEKTFVYVQGYDDYTGLHFSNGLTLGDASVPSQTTWTALFIDGGPQGGTYALDGTSTLDLTGVTVAGGTYGTNPSFAAIGSKPIVVDGVLTGDVITGTSAAEAFIGSTGDDTINAGGGNDLVLYNVGDGHDTVDGGPGFDTLALVNLTNGAPSATPATFAVGASGTHLTVDTDGIGAHEIDATGMDALQVQLGNGGDTVTLSGNIAATGVSAIAVTGGSGADTLDASGLTSANAITSSNLGGGDDTFKAANVIANDVVDGAGGTGDTADYSAASAAVTIDLTAGTATGTSIGSDTIAHFENATGGAAGDTLHGTVGNNALTGNGGIDTTTYSTVITAGMISTNGSGGWTVTSAGEGTDTLSTVEVVQGADPDGAGPATGKFLLVGNGGYATFDAAYADAADGDTIVLAPGTYAGDHTIDKAISVVGANLNVNGAGARGSESVLTGHWTVNAAGPVVIAGVEFLNNTPWVSGTNDTRLTLATAATVTHSVFYNTRPGGDKPISDIAINVTATTGAVSIFDNLFSGDSHGKYFAPANGSGPDAAAAAWGGGTNGSGNSGAIVWGGGSALDVDGNTIQYARTALNLAGDDALLTINGNTINTSGTGLTVTGWQGPVNSLTSNAFHDVDNELNARSNAVGIDISLGTNTSDNWFSVLGTTGADIINGTSGKDAILAEQGDDTVHTGQGNDSIFVNTGSGNDIVDGGSESGGKDTLIVSNTASANGTLDPGDAGDPATSTSGSPSSTPVTFTLTPTAGNTVHTTDGTGTDSAHDISVTMATTAGATPLGSVTADEIEDVQFNLGNGGDTVDISGDFSTTSLSTSTITVNGGTGGDTVDARNLSSTHSIHFSGGGGADTFISSNAGGNDTFDGGADGANGDTVDYSHVLTGGVTVNLSNTGAQNTASAGTDTLVNVENVIGTSFADTFTGNSSHNAITGGGGIDTATGYGSGYQLAIQGGHWVVTNGTDTDTLTGVERVQINGTTYLLVDQMGANVGGFQHVQDAVDYASGGETILVAPGTYTESHTTVSGAAGIYINTPNLTLQGVHGDGSFVTSALDAQTNGPTIISGHENNFGANHWIDVGGTNTTIDGLHLEAGPFTTNKVLEIWANNVTVENSFIDTNANPATYALTLAQNPLFDATTGYTGAAAVYFNDNGTTASDNITAYTVDHNILNEGIIVANGVGNPANGIGANQLITNNRFEGVFNPGTGEGRYDTIVINGQVAGVGWLLEPTQTPTITGNTFANNTTPFIIRGSDNLTANLPTAAQIADVVAQNGDANLTYAYVLTPTGDLRVATRDDGFGTYHSFAVTNSIDTLNLALDTTPDNVFGGQRDYIHAGDTVVVQSGATGTVNSQIMVENLTVEATANSADLNLTLATNLVDGTPIAGGGVHNVTLADYAPGLGANVDVTGNGLDNIIVGNSGANTLDGGAGDDTLTGGKGADSLIGGSNTAVGDTADYSKETGGNGVTVDLGAGTATDTFGTHDTLSGIENVIGSSHADSLTGSAVANTLTGKGGDDAIHGGGGSDTAVFSGDVSDYTITWNGTTATVQDNRPSSPDGTDTVDSVGHLQFANHSVWLVGQGAGNDFTTIQAAVDAAHDGDTILVAAGTYNENVTIHGKQITLDGAGDTLAGTVITGQVTIDSTLDGALTIKDVLIDATGQQYGVFASANSTTYSGSITLDTVKIENAQTDGFAYIRAGNGSTPTLTDTVGSISIFHSIFSNNATANTGGNGRGDILLFGYNQNLTINDVTVGSPGAASQKAIQMRGLQDGGDTTNAGPYDAAGNVSLTNLTVTGSYAQDLVAFYRIASFASFTMSGVSLDATAPWGLINFDEVGGTIDLSTGLATAINHAVGGIIATPQGLASADTFTGTSGHDILVGRGGADIIHGGGGDDTIIYTTSDGPDTLIDGGSGSDTLQIVGTAANNSVNVVVSGGVIAALDGATVTGIEHVTLDLGGGTGDTLSYAGTGAAQSVTVNLATGAATGFDTPVVNVENVTGGDGNDSLTGNGNANVLSGGAGNDAINGNGGVDTLSGGTGDDTFTYDLATGGQATVDGGADTDTQTVNGTASTETFNINPTASGDLGVYIHSGASDPATDANAQVRTTGVEEIVINTNGGGDSVIVTGDLGGTGVATSTVTVNGDAGNNTFDASGVTGATPVGVLLDGAGGTDTLTGGAGNDTLIGGDGNDVLKGGAGDDTIYGGTNLNASDTGAGDQAVYDHTPGGYSVTFNNNGTVTVQDTNSADGDEGTDTLAGVETLNFGGAVIDLTANVLVYQGVFSGTGPGTLIGSYSTISDALAAAGTVAGDTLVLKAHSFNETVQVDKSVTILGANRGIDGTGTRGAESIITDGLQVNANNVTIDGVDIAGSHQFSGPPWPVGFYILGNNVTLENSVVDGTGLAGSPLPGVTSPSVTGLDISHNLIEEWTGGGIYVSGNGAGSIDHNTFNHNGNGVVTESTATIISDNHFNNSVGSQVAALPFVDTDVSTYVSSDNTFTGSAQSVSIYPNETGAQSITGTVFDDKFKARDNDGDHGLSNGPFTLSGGQGNDIYYVNNTDTVIEAPNQGTDEVRSTSSFTLSANVENLTLLDGPSDTETFENMALGPITDGEHGWTVLSSHDQEVVDSGDINHGKVFRMSSDPASGDFGGPYSPALSATAGEPSTSAEYDGQYIRFDLKSVSNAPDGSRLEVDFGNAAGTDRNNFMVIENVGTGIRIAVASPDNNTGDFGPSDAFPNDWTTLVTGVDPSVEHHIDLQVVYKDGPNNDVINVYLDGQFIGTTTTFENYRDLAAPAFPGATHADNAEANQTNRVFFRAGDNGQPQDGPGSANQGFYFDNVNYGVGAVNGTGNADNNIITGNSGDNTLTGLGGDDTLIGGAGIDTFVYGIGDGHDTVDGGTGIDTQVVNGTSAAETFNINPVSGTQLGINIESPAAAATLANSEVVTTNVEEIVVNTGDGGDTVNISGNLSGTGVSVSTITVNGGTGNDTVDARNLSSTHHIDFNGGTGDDTFISSNAGGNDTFDGGGNTGTGDTVDYSHVSIGVSVNLTAGTATGAGAGTDTLSGVENVIGTAQADTFVGASGVANSFIGGDGVDTVNYAAESGSGAIAVNLSSGSFGPGSPAAGHAIDRGGATDTLSGIENVTADNATYGDIVGLDGAFSDWTLTFNTDHWTATRGLETHEFQGIEELAFQGSPGIVHLVDPTHAASAYTSVQDAVNHAASGDTILLSSGSFAGLLTVDKDVTIEGAKAGVDGRDPGRGTNETILTDGVKITHDGATIDGVEITGSFDSVTSDGTDVPNALLIKASNVTIQNSLFDGTGSDVTDARPFSTSTTVTGLEITHNSFGHWAEGAYIVAGHSGTIEHNDFHDNGNDILTESTTMIISDNTFENSSGSHVASLSNASSYDASSFILDDNTFSNDHPQSVSIYPNAPGAQTITGTDHNDNFKGDSVAGSGPFTFDGGAGSDRIVGGAGNDTVIGTADGVNDSYDGAGGTDTIDYSGLSLSSQSITANLGAGVASGASIGTDMLFNFENLNSGAGDDSLFGSNANNVIHGGSGADNIVGGGGSDTLFGDAGNDTLNGGVNDFMVTPAAANDVLFGGAGADTFRFEGRFGNDAIGAVGTPDWADGEDIVLVGYAGHAPLIANTAGGVTITIDDGSVASSVFVAGATAAQMQVATLGSDLLIH
jgi:VCBS repeat-containing protein